MYEERCIGWMPATEQAEKCNVSGFLLFVRVEHTGGVLDHHRGFSARFHTRGRQEVVCDCEIKDKVLVSSSE